MSTTTDAIIDTIFRRASRFQERHVQEAYYVEPDNGLDFCERCARKKVREGMAKEVWRADRSADHDSPPTCHRCLRWLAGWLTGYGAREELDCLEDGFNPRRHLDCYLWMLCENSFLRESEEYGRLMRLIAPEGQRHA